MSSSSNKHVNVERRTWDKEAYESRARSRASAEAGDETANATAASPSAAPSKTNSTIANALNPSEEKEEFLPASQGRAGPMGSQRAFLKSRSRKVDLESKLGTTEIIDPGAAAATKSNLSGGVGAGAIVPSAGVTKCTDGVGWHCRVCDCFLKDSLTYLDHINGRKHQRYLGYSMRVEKSTTEEVSGVLKGLADEKRERERDRFGGFIGTSCSSGDKGAMGNSIGEIDFEEVVRKKDEDALKKKAERARKREERKRKEAQEKIKGNAFDQDHERSEIQTDEEKKDGNDEDVEEEEDEFGGVDPNVAAMMGFSGFGGSKK